MSTLKKIIPTTSHIAKPRRQDRQSASGEVQSMVVDAATARQILELERKLRFQLKETERARDDANKWTSLYHTEVERAEKAEGLLSLRDASIIDYKALLAKKIAQIKLLKKKLFDKSSEKGALTPSSSQPASTGPAKKNKRGKKKGAPGFGRNNHDGLATGAVITTNVSVADMVCADCGAAECPVGFEESKDVEVEVKAYKRLLRRQKVGHFCKCKKKWTTKTARAHAKLIKRGGYAISFWIFCLLGKFVFHTPLNRLRLQLAMQGLVVPAGTIVGGFKRIYLMLAPLIEEIKRYSREQKHHWHIDDTGWKVFVQFDGKTGHRWYLWVFLSQDVCLYSLSPWRSRAVPKSHLEHSVGVVTGDRLEANKKLGDNITNSFCWVHIRRELRQLLVSYPEIAALCTHLLTLIGSLYFHNVARQLAEPNSNAKQAADKALRDNMAVIRATCENHLTGQKLHSELRRVCAGILKDWEGLVIFMDIPEIPPDNNPAERALRGPVVGRKNYSGSSSEWSGHLAAAMFSLNETLKLNGMNTQIFLQEYLMACALNGGHAPPNAKDYLPWNRHLLPPEISTDPSN